MYECTLLRMYQPPIHYTCQYCSIMPLHYTVVHSIISNCSYDVITGHAQEKAAIAFHKLLRMFNS
jgi:hypothetical protein